MRLRPERSERVVFSHNSVKFVLSFSRQNKVPSSANLGEGKSLSLSHWAAVCRPLSLLRLENTFWKSLASKLLDQMLDVHVRRRATRPPSFQSAASSLQPRCSASPRQQQRFHKLCFSFKPSVHFPKFNPPPRSGSVEVPSHWGLSLLATVCL